MSHGYCNYNSLDNEKRYLRIALDRVRRAVATHKKKRQQAEDELSKLKKEYQKQEQLIEQLRKDNEEIKRQRDMYKDMLFKKNVESDHEPESPLLTHVPKRKRGGQYGHKGHGRLLPLQINSYKRVYTKTCPDCHTKLKRSVACLTYTVEDILEPHQ